MTPSRFFPLGHGRARRAQAWAVLALIAAGAMTTWSADGDRPAGPPPGGAPGEGFRGPNREFGPSRRDGAPGGSERGGGPHRPGFTPSQGPMLDRWMEHLREENPAEFARLQKLREEDPDKFREDMRTRVREKGLETLQSRYPKVHEAIMSLPPEQREWFHQRMAMPGEGDHMMRPMDPADRDPAVIEGEEKVRALSLKLREAKDDAECERLRADLRVEVARVFDLRHQRRLEEFKRFEEQLRKIRETLEQRNANREAIIDARLKEITEGPPPGPRSDAPPGRR